MGLHQKDNIRLLKTLKKLRDLGNTVLVVEHDEQTILSSDHVIDMGPGAGLAGGNVIFSGTPKKILKNKRPDCKDSPGTLHLCYGSFRLREKHFDH